RSPNLLQTLTFPSTLKLCNPPSHLQFSRTNKQVAKFSVKNFHPVLTEKSDFGTLFDLRVRPTFIRSDDIGRPSDDHRTALG
ncbi:MAG: hypothetical protein P9L99_06970, partial [Candidatus Lernaella stagnicola]|nr:hypothetical protein [Candidatus Lernaella stagnicola]